MYSALGALSGGPSIKYAALATKSSAFRFGSAFKCLLNTNAHAAAAAAVAALTTRW